MNLQAQSDYQRLRQPSDEYSHEQAYHTRPAQAHYNDNPFPTSGFVPVNQPSPQAFTPPSFRGGAAEVRSKSPQITTGPRSSRHLDMNEQLTSSARRLEREIANLSETMNEEDRLHRVKRLKASRNSRDYLIRKSFGVSARSYTHNDDNRTSRHDNASSGIQTPTTTTPAAHTPDNPELETQLAEAKTKFEQERNNPPSNLEGDELDDHQRRLKQRYHTKIYQIRQSFGVSVRGDSSKKANSTTTSVSHAAFILPASQVSAPSTPDLSAMEKQLADNEAHHQQELASMPPDLSTQEREDLAKRIKSRHATKASRIRGSFGVNLRDGMSKKISMDNITQTSYQPQYHHHRQQQARGPENGHTSGGQPAHSRPSVDWRGLSVASASSYTGHHPQQPGQYLTANSSHQSTGPVLDPGNAFLQARTEHFTSHLTNSPHGLPIPIPTSGTFYTQKRKSSGGETASRSHLGGDLDNPKRRCVSGDPAEQAPPSRSRLGELVQQHTPRMWHTAPETQHRPPMAHMGTSNSSAGSKMTLPSLSHALNMQSTGSMLPLPTTMSPHLSPILSSGAHSRTQTPVPAPTVQSTASPAPSTKPPTQKGEPITLSSDEDAGQGSDSESNDDISATPYSLARSRAKLSLSPKNANMGPALSLAKRRASDGVPRGSGLKAMTKP